MTALVKCISEFEKDNVVASYKNKVPLTILAVHHNTSTRTIGRVLEERGLATPVPRLKGEAYTVMKALQQADIPAKLAPEMITILTTAGIRGVAELQDRLKPRVTSDTVQTYLNQCTKEQLAHHFYASGLIKLAEITQQAHADRKQQQAALFRPVAQAQEPFQFAAAH